MQVTIHLFSARVLASVLQDFLFSWICWIKKILRSLCFHIVRYNSLRVRVQNFCCYRFGSKSIMVDLFTIVYLSISSMHKPVATKRSEFNTHCRSIFLTHPPYDHSIFCPADQLKRTNRNSLHNSHSFKPRHSQSTRHNDFSLPAPPSSLNPSIDFKITPHISQQ